MDRVQGLCDSILGRDRSGSLESQSEPPPYTEGQMSPEPEYPKSMPTRYRPTDTLPLWMAEANAVPVEIRQDPRRLALWLQYYTSIGRLELLANGVVLPLLVMILIIIIVIILFMTLMQS